MVIGVRVGVRVRVRVGVRVTARVKVILRVGCRVSIVAKMWARFRVSVVANVRNMDMDMVSDRADAQARVRA